MPKKKKVNVKALHQDEREAFVEISDVLDSLINFKSDFERKEGHKIKELLAMIRGRLISSREAFGGLIEEVNELDEANHTIEITSRAIRQIHDAQDQYVQNAKKITHTAIHDALKIPKPKPYQNEALGPKFVSTSAIITTDSSPCIENSLRTIIREILHNYKGVINPETFFVGDMGADSLNMVELIVRIEEEFDITIPDEYLGCDKIWKDFRQCVDYVRIELKTQKGINPIHPRHLIQNKNPDDYDFG